MVWKCMEIANFASDCMILDEIPKATPWQYYTCISETLFGQNVDFVPFLSYYTCIWAQIWAHDHGFE